MFVPRIRNIALCIFHHQGKILVNSFRDPVTQQLMHRPLGGGIEFGERSVEALAREVREELNVSISGLELVGYLESLFSYAGKPGHEIVHVYDGRFDDSGIYEKSWLEGLESDGIGFRAVWRDNLSFTTDEPLVPEGLYELLKSRSLLA